MTPGTDGQTAGGAGANPAVPEEEIAALAGFVRNNSRLFVLTGAGCSTASGIPDYRDAEGAWKRPPPMDFRTFMGSAGARQRYWARGMIGWRRFGKAEPNAAHRALAMMQQQGRIAMLVTQNVDGLHEAAGSEDVIDLHGRMDLVRCMQCERRHPRALVQEWLEALNPGWLALEATMAPDGDADIEGIDFSTFLVPPCPVCGGILKPDVVYFGESVPPERVAAASAGLALARGVLVVGSSLMVYSGFRFVTAASRAGQPIAAINLGHTRADSMLALKVSRPCGDTLTALMAALAAA